jgi:hypothetical protein
VPIRAAGLASTKIVKNSSLKILSRCGPHWWERSPAFDGCYALLGQDQNLARRLYAGAKKKFMIKEPDGSAHINFPPELGGGEDLVGFGAAAACAWEFGDSDTHAQLMTWANKHYQPTAKEGERPAPKREEFTRFGLVGSVGFCVDAGIVY